MRSNNAPSETTSTSIRTAFGHLLASDTAVRTMNTSFNKARKAIEEDLSSAGRNKRKALIILLEETTKSYVLRLAMEHPEVLPAGAESALKATAKTLRTLSDIDLNKKIRDWATEGKENISKFTFDTVNRIFKSRG